MNLPLLQLGDSALPIGGFSHSWGLESALERGLVTSPQALEEWTRRWLRHSVAPMEGVVLVAAFRAIRGERRGLSPPETCNRSGFREGINPSARQIIVRANRYLEVGLLPSTLRQASRDMGDQLRRLAEPWPWAAAAIPYLTGGPWHHAVVFGVLAGCATDDAGRAVSVYLHQAALGMIGAGVRAIPIGHTHGQLILARLHDDLTELAADLRTCDLESAGSVCPAYEELCNAQQRLYTRLFRS
jgi:urease accessory protein